MKNRIKSVLCFILCACLLVGLTGAENLWSDDASDETVQEVTEDTLIDTLNTDSNYVVTNAKPSVPTDDQLTEYSYTPLDVVLVMDVSGSMASQTLSRQQVLTLAQEAARIFVTTLFELSAPSRIGLISFSTGVNRLTSGSMGLTDENTLIRLIRSTQANGSTNTGAAYEETARLLDSMQRPDTRQVVIMLTDGIPYGTSNAEQHAISAGNALKKDNRLIYTIGLIGGLYDYEVPVARQVLNAGYETRYFEVDNKGAAGSGTVMKDMGKYTALTGSDYAAMMASIFQSIVVSATDQSDNSQNYSLWLDDNMEIRVTDAENTGYLSSASLDYSDTAPFGSLSIAGEDKSQKILTLKDGAYTITLRGTRTGKGSYQLTAITGISMIPRTLFKETNINTHPAQVLRFDVSGGNAVRSDLSWDPLDHSATDPFTGLPTRGSEIAAPGKVTKKATLYAWKSKKATTLLTVSQGAYVEVLASSADNSWLLTATVDKEGRTVRGWMENDTVRTEGYVPKLIPDIEKTYTVSAAVTSRTAPSVASVEGRKVKKGEKITTIHAERDASGQEWVYGMLSDKKATAVYLPADSLENWESVCPEGFRIGYAMPTVVWQKTFGGKGYTEFMWAASELNGSGVAVSGRTDSKTAPLKAKYGGRDAIAMVLTPDGEILKSAVLGGSDVDSFHCIVPTEDGYYVSGITRSNNKDFADIWDNETCPGKKKATTDKSNALIGKLNPDLSIRWLKSFGTGKVSYGFDVVVPTTDGNIAGCGWLFTGKGSIFEGKGGEDFLVVKLTDNGSLINYAILGDGGSDVPDSATATDDGGLMIVGKSSDNARVYVLDEYLYLRSSVIFGGPGEDLFDNIRNMGDGSYLATGLTNSYSSSTDYWAVQLDTDGRMIWEKTYGGSGIDEVCGTTVLPDGTSVLVGYTTSTNGTVQGATGTGKDAWAVCIDKTGRVLWQYVASLSGDDWFNAAAVDSSDGGIVLVGARDSNGKSSAAKGYAVKILPPQLSSNP